MAYSTVNFKTKKELVAAVKAGRSIGVYSPGPFPVTQNGKVVIEGPHYPQPHRWYASAEVSNGVIVKVK